MDLGNQNPGPFLTLDFSADSKLLGEKETADKTRDPETLNCNPIGTQILENVPIGTQSLKWDPFGPSGHSLDTQN